MNQPIMYSYPQNMMMGQNFYGQPNMNMGFMANNPMMMQGMNPGINIGYQNPMYMMPNQPQYNPIANNQMNQKGINNTNVNNTTNNQNMQNKPKEQENKDPFSGLLNLV